MKKYTRCLHLLVLSVFCLLPNIAKADTDVFDEYPTLFAHINGITISFQDMGPKDGCPIVFIMGLGVGHTYWGDPFIRTFVESGYRVIALDNRDSGLSQRYESFGNPILAWNLLLLKLGIQPSLPYTLQDMADDVVKLLDHLNIQSAHIVGASMGSMIGQMVSASYPDRVDSFISMMSSSGAPHLEIGEVPNVAPPDPEASREEHIEYGLRMWRAGGGTNDAVFDEAYARRRLEKDFDRTQQGWILQERQLLAILSFGDRSEYLKLIKVPTLVLHGSNDPYFSLTHAEHVASLISDSKLLVIDGLGHELDPVMIPKITDAIQEHVRFAESIHPAETPEGCSNMRSD
jgi:pimeloyl-ACP methyl ester carboxylesterase